MSSDYDRLFHPPERGAVPPDDATTTVDRDAILRAAGAPTPPAVVPVGETSSTEVPTAEAPLNPLNEAHAASEPRHAETAPHTLAPMPQPPQATPQWPQNFGQAPPQQFGQTGRHEQPAGPPRPDPWPPAGPAPAQPPVGPEVSGTRWETSGASWGPLIPNQGQPGSGATGHHRAIDGLSQVGFKTSAKTPPQRGWRHWLYASTRINLGQSPDEIYELELHHRIRRNARDSYQIGVVGLKGGAGKTAVTVTLGSVMAKVRGDRILAIDADPDAGNLGDRVGRQSAATIADLLAGPELARYNDVRAYTNMNRANLEALSSADYSRAGREFNDEDWQGATEVVSRYYNLVLADAGTGLFQKGARGVLESVSGLVIVASASIDGARQAAITMDWLGQNGYQRLLGRSCVVINHVTPGKANVDVEDLVQQFERHVPEGRVIVLPYDKHIASGAEINFDLLSRKFQRRITELAAALSDDFDKADQR